MINKQRSKSAKILFWLIILVGLLWAVFIAPEILNGILVLILSMFVIFVGIIIFIFAFNIIKNKVTFSDMLKVMPMVLKQFISSKERELIKESEQLNAILNNDCDSEKFLEAVTPFLNQQLPPYIYVVLHWNKSFAYYDLGDIPKAIENLNELHAEIKNNSKLQGIITDYLIYDQFVFYHLLTGDNQAADYFATLRDNEPTKKADKTHPHSQGLRAFTEGRFEDALAHYQKRDAYYQAKKIAQTTLGQAEQAYYYACVYEQLGMEAEVIEALTTFVTLAKQSPRGRMASEKLEQLGVSLPESESAEEMTTDDAPAKPKSNKILPYIIICLIILALWFFINNS